MCAIRCSLCRCSLCRQRLRQRHSTTLLIKSSSSINNNNSVWAERGQCKIAVCRAETKREALPAATAQQPPCRQRQRLEPAASWAHQQVVKHRDVPININTMPTCVTCSLREREITGEQAREREQRGERAVSSSPSQAWQLANERTKRTRRLVMLTQTSVCAQEQQKQQRQQRQRIQQIHTHFENTGFFSFSLSLSLFSRRPSSLTKICFHFSVNGGTWLSLDVCERMRGICMCV